MSSLSEVVTNALSAIGATLLTDLMILLLLAVFSAAILLRLRNQAYAFTNYVPTLLTIIGLLGTFSGILVGLLEFNIQKIDGSIGALLAGLKTAFIASLTGILLSVIYKTLISTEILKPLKQYQNPADQISTEEHIQSILQSQFLTQQNHQHIAQQQLNALHMLNERIHGFEMRLDQRINKLTQQVSIHATQQITDGLEKVVNNFNHQINHQFGEQFGQLNQAVHALVTWQTEHKHQLIAMQTQYQLGIEQFQQLQDRLQQAQQFWQESLNVFEPIPTQLYQLMQEVSAIIVHNQDQMQHLEPQFARLADIQIQAAAAIPSVNQLMKAHIEQLQLSQQMMQKHQEQQLLSFNEEMQAQVGVFMSEVTHMFQQITKNLKQETSRVTTGVIPGVVSDLKQVPLSAQEIMAQNQNARERSRTL